MKENGQDIQHFYGKVLENNEPLFLILSGLGRPRNTMTNRKLISLLEDRNLSYQQYDHTGHGERKETSSYTLESSWQDFVSALRHIDSFYSEKEIIPVLNSFPSAIILKNIMNLDATLKEKIRYIVAIAPILDTQKAFEAHLQGIKLKHIVKSKLLCQFFQYLYKVMNEGTTIEKELFLKELISGEYSNISLKDLDIPTLILFNEEDKKVNIEQIKESRKNPNISYMKYGKGKQHYLDMYQRYPETGKSYGEEIIDRVTS